MRARPLALFALTFMSGRAYSLVPTMPTRILAYGDSLTAGFYDHGDGYRPYATRLGELLGIRVDHIGLCGYTVAEMVQAFDAKQRQDRCGRILPGLAHTLRKAKVDNQPYDSVILLGGSNDLASESHGFRDAKSILEVSPVFVLQCVSPLM